MKTLIAVVIAVLLLVSPAWALGPADKVERSVPLWTWVLEILGVWSDTATEDPEPVLELPPPLEAPSSPLPEEEEGETAPSMDPDG